MLKLLLPRYARSIMEGRWALIVVEELAPKAVHEFTDVASVELSGPNGDRGKDVTKSRRRDQ